MQVGDRHCLVSITASFTNPDPFNVPASWFDPNVPAKFIDSNPGAVRLIEKVGSVGVPVAVNATLSPPPTRVPFPVMSRFVCERLSVNVAASMEPRHVPVRVWFGSLESPPQATDQRTPTNKTRA